MVDIEGRISRRFLIGSAIVEGYLFSSICSARTETSHTSIESVNLELMRDFWKAWDQDDLDIEALVAEYFDNNAIVRWIDEGPQYIGAHAAAEAARTSMPSGSRAVISVHKLFAYGPMVASNRTDVIKIPGKADTVIMAAGVAFIKSGKIIEYIDYDTPERIGWINFF